MKGSIQVRNCQQGPSDLSAPSFGDIIGPADGTTGSIAALPARANDRSVSPGTSQPGCL